MLPIRHILVPIDWAELSLRAFQFAAALAREYDAELLVLHVVPLPAVMYGPPPESYMDQLLEKLRRTTPNDPKTHVRRQLAEGDPARAILRVARETHCDLIVMGTHGRTGLDRFFLGSVAEEVVRKAPCLVLTVNNEVPANLLGSRNAPEPLENQSTAAT
jgi:nucleotide-binding universal stress UspA family protein